MVHHCGICLAPTIEPIRICSRCQKLIGQIELSRIDRNRYALLEYGPLTQFLVSSMKGGRLWQTSFWFGERLFAKVFGQQSLSSDFNILWPPSSNPKKFMDHGYWLAQGFGSRGGHICSNYLKRTSQNPNKELGKLERQKLEMIWGGSQEIGPGRLWVVDDVLTTGATMKAVERALGREVMGIALCWKP